MYQARTGMQQEPIALNRLNAYGLFEKMSYGLLGHAIFFSNFLFLKEIKVNCHVLLVLKTSNCQSIRNHL